jgi:carbon monoxide dehydrogenase subunit G
MEGRTAEFTGKMTEYDLYKRSRKIMDFGNFTNEDELTFEPVDTGTRFTLAYDVKVRGFAKLLSSRINSAIRRELEEAVRSLKTILEAKS